MNGVCPDPLDVIERNLTRAPVRESIRMRIAARQHAPQRGVIAIDIVEEMNRLVRLDHRGAVEN